MCEGSEGVSEVLRRLELEEGNGDATTSKTRIFLPNLFGSVERELMSGS